MKSITYSAKNLAREILKSFGYTIQKDSASLSLESALRRCKFRNLHIHPVIDIGASNGSWSIIASTFFPDAFYYLIEANPIHTEELEKLKNKWNQKHEYILACAGDTNGEIYFDASDPFGGLASHKPFEKNNLKLPVVTVDHVTASNKLAPPYLLKLDTHGFEIPIFEGASETLKQTNLIIVEAYNFDIADKSLRFYKMCDYLETKGFRCVDMCDPLFRPKDRAFWQVDLFFIPASNNIFNDNKYQ